LFYDLQLSFLGSATAIFGAIPEEILNRNHHQMHASDLTSELEKTEVGVSVPGSLNIIWLN
jgi:hypothetical protein